MIKKLFILMLICLPCHAYTVYYPKDFTPSYCNAWIEEGHNFSRKLIVSCFGKQAGETIQYYTEATVGKRQYPAVKPPFSIKYKPGAVRARIYLEKED